MAVTLAVTAIAGTQMTLRKTMPFGVMPVLAAVLLVQAGCSKRSTETQVSEAPPEAPAWRLDESKLVCADPLRRHRSRPGQERLQRFFRHM